MLSSNAGEIPSPSSSSSAALTHTTPKTMEEVWKDINLSTLVQDSRPATPSLSLEAPLSHKSTTSYRGMILQDFLAGAFKDPPASSASGQLPHLPLPPIVLSLNTSAFLQPGFDYSGFQPGPPASAAAACGSDDIMVSHYPSKKRIVDDPSCISGDGRRHKRMIKNRESAARSRARKQAYTNELELQIAHLTQENAKLKKQNEELREAMAAEHPNRKVLQRTSTAPF
ncbi:protein FD-like [Phalaenopsis equestris]|uniref:protein FD-like n=1 Tax=Phalaenopsis equestris TaxID=78828 RepID=UPI0009E342CB|nr:protein FD-like [Phalaenopsis equestris]